MVMGYYYSMFGISLMLLIIYTYIFHKRFDVNLTIMAVLVPIINLGFVLMGNSKVIEEALIALRITYFGGCFLLVSVMFLILNICGIKKRRWLRTIVICISITFYAFTLSIGYSDIFYKGIPTLAFYGGAAYITNKQYGIAHTFFYIMVGVCYSYIIGIIVFSFFKKKQVPRKILALILSAVTIAMIGFFGGRLISQTIEILPVSYNMGLIIYLVIATKLRLYDASDSATEALVQKGDTGFISFDSNMRYLGSNQTAKLFFPELNELIVDHFAKENEWANDLFIPFVNRYHNNETDNKFYVEKDDKVYLIVITPLILGLLYKGYQFIISDDTKNQEYIQLIQKYNNQLEEEVQKKTKHILDMHNQLVMGVATMIEGRDNSTGGHIKRTSMGVKFIVDEMIKEHYEGVPDSFYNKVVRAAPMHDLGKIVVDDAILRKPGKFTPEEFELMKAHAPEGARIVEEILKGTDDKEFMRIAVNVAHYHHERWDGSGYPCGLKGNEIPLEARIMAIADVYDALVSKRVYKEKFSFEEANRIILDGMGKHFDKSLETYYLKARQNLEDYYSKIS